MYLYARIIHYYPAALIPVKICFRISIYTNKLVCMYMLILEITSLIETYLFIFDSQFMELKYRFFKITL